MYRFKVDELKISQNALNINIFYNINRILIIEQVKLTGYSSNFVNRSTLNTAWIMRYSTFTLKYVNLNPATT